jgi:hypothetical protein
MSRGTLSLTVLVHRRKDVDRSMDGVFVVAEKTARRSQSCRISLVCFRAGKKRFEKAYNRREPCSLHKLTAARYNSSNCVCSVLLLCSVLSLVTNTQIAAEFQRRRNSFSMDYFAIAYNVLLSIVAE